MSPQVWPDPAPLDSGVITVGSGGGAPAYGTGWAAAGGSNGCQFRKVGRLVTLSLDCSGGVSGSVIFTLPVGFRPSFVTASAASAVTAPNGVVSINSTTGTVSWYNAGTAGRVIASMAFVVP